MRQSKFVATAGMVMAAVMISAQPQFQAGGNFSLAYPQKDFRKNIDNVGIGASGHFAYRFGRSPFLAGASLGFWIYGSQTREVPFPGVEEVTVDVTTTNSFVMGHLMFRVQPQAGPVRPYIDGLLGFNFLNTSTDISSQDSDWEGSNKIAGSNNSSDIASNYGFGGGLMIRVYDAVAHGREGGLQAVFVELSIRSLKGGKAEYMKEGSIREENEHVVYDKYKSETDLVTYHLGVSFDFTIHSSTTEE
jgi:hypothetical protein